VIERKGFSKVGRGEGIIGVEGDGNSNDEDDCSAKGHGRGVIGVEGDGNKVWCVERCFSTRTRSSSEVSTELNSSCVLI
jgi:hypothetical protein